MRNPVFMNGIEAKTDNARVSRFVINPIFNGVRGLGLSKDGMSILPSPLALEPHRPRLTRRPPRLWKEFRPNSGGTVSFVEVWGKQLKSVAVTAQIL